MGTASERLKEKTGTTERESGWCWEKGETRERVNGNVPRKGERKRGNRKEKNS